jgi:hypothetical protein
MQINGWFLRREKSANHLFINPKRRKIMRGNKKVVFRGYTLVTKNKSRAVTRLGVLANMTTEECTTYTTERAAKASDENYEEWCVVPVEICIVDKRKNH